MTIREAGLETLSTAFGAYAALIAVDVVIDLLAGNLLHAAWRGSALFGAAWVSRWAWRRSHPQPNRSEPA